MDDKLIMAIDIVEVLRIQAASSPPELRAVLQHAAIHIENLRKIADSLIMKEKTAPPPAAPISRAFDPDDYKRVAG